MSAQLARATNLVASLSSNLAPAASHDDASAGTVSEPSVAEIRDQLTKILASNEFIHSVRLCRFLTYTVDRTLAGEADALKEYTIGRDVFDRGEHYDQRHDSIVRVEARRLRLKLEAYYRHAGAFDPVTILYRPGHYAPVFNRRSEATAA